MAAIRNAGATETVGSAIVGEGSCLQGRDLSASEPDRGVTDACVSHDVDPRE